MVRRNIHPRIQIWVPGDNLTASALAEEIDRFPLEELPPCLVVDLRRVRQASSDGLVWLVNLRLEALRTGRFLVLLDPSPEVQRVLRAARVHGRFEMAASLEEAVAMARTDEIARGLIRMRSEH